jgi:hypothetical protein
MRYGGLVGGIAMYLCSGGDRVVAAVVVEIPKASEKTPFSHFVSRNGNT